MVGVRLQTTNGGTKTQIETFTDKVHVLKPLTILGNSGASFVGDNSADSRIGTDDSTRSFSIENTFGKYVFQSDLNFVIYKSILASPFYQPIHASDTGQSSERHLKTNIHSIGVEAGTAVIQQLHPVTFQYNESSGLGNLEGTPSVHCGLIVDECEPVLPQLVHTIGSSKLVHLQKAVPHLIACVQHLLQRVSALEAAGVST